VALIVGGVALNEFVLRPQGEARQAARALTFENAVKALDEARYADAEAAFTEIMAKDAKLAPLAAHFLAQTKYEGSGDAAGATEVLASVGGTEGGPYTRLALLKSAYFQADQLSFEELEITLGSLIHDDGTTGVLARELLAAKAFEAGDFTRARTEFNRLRFDPAATEGVARRAEVALAAIPLQSEPQEQPDPAPAEMPEAPQETGQ
ncbi:MAG: hypothetical protein ACK40A_14925, partial [Pannonibacter indicus]